MPLELIVIDQSDSSESRELVEPLFDNSEVKLIYSLDSSVSGLVNAKNVGRKLASGEVICFLEDDIVLHNDYFYEIIAGFDTDSSMVGCSGIITNQPLQHPSYVFMHKLFFRGIFNDPRIEIFSSKGHVSNMVRCDMISGGLSAWRSYVFENIKFDASNDFFMFEDIEFSTRVARVYKDSLYVNLNAKLEHKWSPVNRDLHGVRQKRKLSEAIIFYKKRKNWDGAKKGILLASIWWFSEALFQSVRVLSYLPLKGFFSGVIIGVNKRLNN